jgi:hypothetical protein
VEKSVEVRVLLAAFFFCFLNSIARTATNRTLNPYATNSSVSSSHSIQPARWSIRTRLKLLAGFVATSVLLTFGGFHAFFLICFRVLQPIGYDIAYRYIGLAVAVGFFVQCMLTAFAFNRRAASAMVAFNAIVVAWQLLNVCSLIKAVAIGP